MEDRTPASRQRLPKARNVSYDPLVGVVDHLARPALRDGHLPYVLLVKAWPTEPLVYAAIVAALLAYRALRQ